MNNKDGLTISMIFKAQSLNYGEGIGNISELKKLSRGDGKVYTFASRQALRYDIVRLVNKMFDWNLDTVRKNGTIQFDDKYTIEDSAEMDLFGYMKTAKRNEDKEGGSSTRSAVVRLSNAISLEEYKSDMDFLNNKGLADRINEFPNLANIEQHLSYYTYTISIDLANVGIDNNIILNNNERLNRVKQLLEIVKVLNRNIRGREENLSPLFIIGGLYNLNTPYFLGRIKIEKSKNGFEINTNMLKDTMSLKLGDSSVEENTKIGIVEGVFSNESEIKNEFGEKVTNIQTFFENLENGVTEYYK